ncbi:unnamed protein product [Sphagnum troendelagicum]
MGAHMAELAEFCNGGIHEGFKVHDFHIAKSDKDLGLYVGAIGSAFMVVRVATAVSWGIAADKYGRKPILLISLISV